MLAVVLESSYSKIAFFEGLSEKYRGKGKTFPLFFKKYNIIRGLMVLWFRNPLHHKENNSKLFLSLESC
tara:strand:+ start:792 stop:998 length:207 start_codon:yes stop_codon:yes gene_type:complete